MLGKGYEWRQNDTWIEFCFTWRITLFKVVSAFVRRKTMVCLYRNKQLRLALLSCVSLHFFLWRWGSSHKMPRASRGHTFHAYPDYRHLPSACSHWLSLHRKNWKPIRRGTFLGPSWYGGQTKLIINVIKPRALLCRHYEEVQPPASRYRKYTLTLLNVAVRLIILH